MLRAFIASQFKKPTGLLGIFTSNLMVKNNQKHYKRLLQDINPRPHEKLLEIGYGPGWGIRMIAETYTTCTIHGIDFSHLMYKRAGKRNKQYIESGRVQLQHGDFLEVPIAQNNYDKIFCLNVVYFWKEVKTPFEKVYALLQEDGSFHMYMADSSLLREKGTPDSVFNKYSIEQVVEALIAAGFSKVEYAAKMGYYVKALKSITQ